MAWRMTIAHTSPLGQRVEYWQNIGNGYSAAESPAKVVVVSGRTVHKGYSCDGTTYETYDRAVKKGWTEPVTK